MKKRLLAMLLAVLLVCSVLTPVAFADDGYIITFDPRQIEGGSLNGAASWRRVPYGQPVGELPVPVNAKPNMSFEGWYDDDFHEITASTVLTGDIVVHAYWMEKQITLPFADMAGHWAYTGVEYCYMNGLMKGMTDTSFGPELPTTRAMVVTVLYRMEHEPPVGGLENPFKDVNFGDWYGSAIVWAADCGIVTGKTSDTFDPNGNITREQLAAILFRYAQYCGYVTDIQYTLNDFKDGGKVSSYAVTPMQWAYAMDLITGIFDGKDFFLQPQGNATRAQIATILMRFMQKVVPHEVKEGFDGLEMTLPASWYLQYIYEAYDTSTGAEMSFYCRREAEEEDGMGGFLFSIAIVDGPVPDFGTEYHIVGALGKGSTYRNVVIVYGGGVACDKYKDLYFDMLAEVDNIVSSFRGYDGWSYGVG